MPTQGIPDIVVYLCRNCIPGGTFKPAQWTESGAHVRVKEIPCSGKIDAQYILHALEGGVKGVCVVTCPHGECTLSQGNYRAEVRIRTVQRLLAEIGLEPQRAELVRCSRDESPERLRGLVTDATCRLSGLVGTGR
jgi:coenzyme F420-reducing hydrogenase delta subunit